MYIHTFTEANSTNLHAPNVCNAFLSMNDVSAFSSQNGWNCITVPLDKIRRRTHHNTEFHILFTRR